jgi:hypothetical protein
MARLTYFSGVPRPSRNTSGVGSFRKALVGVVVAVANERRFVNLTKCRTLLHERNILVPFGHST